MSVDLAVPRNRDGSFEPQIVKKRQRRLTGVDDMVISLSAKGLTTGHVFPGDSVSANAAGWSWISRRPVGHWFVSI